MSKIVTRARQLRLNHQAKLGRPVTMEEVAEAIGITRAALSRIELNQTERIDFDTIRKLCLYYDVGVGELLELKREDMRCPVLAAA